MVIFACCLFTQVTKAFCEEKEIQVDAGQEQGGGFYASSPECTSGLAEVIIGSAIIIIAGKDFIVPGILDMIKAPTPIKRKIALARVLIGEGMVIGTVLSMSAAYQCFFSFVRDPVVYKNDDPSKEMLDEDSKPVTERWKAAKAVYSENINVCARRIPPYLAVIDYHLYGALGSDIKDYSCYNTTENYGDKNNFYDGQFTFLCPEEWRFHGRRSEIRKNPDNDSKKDKFAIEGNGIPEDRDSTVTKEKRTIVYDTILFQRRYAGPLKCKNGKVGEELKIHGFKYKIIKQGPKICALLKGLGELPSISGSFIVGCHYTKPAESEPLCEKSEPVYAKVDDTTFALDPATGEKIRIDWNNSKCMSCYIDSSCHGSSATHSKAVMPITSYIMECMHGTLQNVILGCTNTTISQDNQGMLTRVSSKIKDLTYIAITLAIVLFAFKILFTNNLPKLNEILTLVIKIGVILYCIQGEGEKNGLKWLYNQISGLSSGLASLSLGAASYQTETSIVHPDNNQSNYINQSERETASMARNTAALCKFPDNLYNTQNSTISTAKNISFLKAYDMLDCRLFFYLGGSLTGYDSSSNTGGVDLEKIVGNSALSLLKIIFPLFILLDPLAFVCGLFLLLFAFVIIGIAVWLVSLLILSMIVLFFLVLIAPLVLPLMLFGYTKSAFENWTKEIIAYTLFPPLLFLFFGMMMAVFDVRMFGDTKFLPIEVKIGTRKAQHFVYEKIDCTTGTSGNPICRKCRDLFVDPKVCDGCDPTSLACKIRNFESQKGTTGWQQSTVKPTKKPKEFVNLLDSMGYIILMAVIFCTMINTIAFLLAELVGKVRSIYEIIGHGISPMTGFMKMSKFTIGIPIKVTKKFINNVKSAKNNNKPKPASGSAGTKP